MPDYIGGLTLVITWGISAVAFVALIFGSAKWSMVAWSVTSGVSMVIGVAWVYLTWPSHLLFPKAFTSLAFITFVTTIISYITFISLDAVTTGYVVFAGPMAILWIMETTKAIVFAPREQATDAVTPWISH